jgi:dipeptidyl aminopeptidase/acylaminoacyl peptidase
VRKLLLALTVVLMVAALPASAARAPITASRDWWPVWSPHDDDIAFTRINGTGRVMQLLIFHLSTHRSTLVGTSASQFTPSWSNDGERLVYASGGLIYVVHRDGSQKHRYFTPAGASAPAWGPNGELAYLVGTNLWVGDAQWAQNVVGQPSWHGDQLAFARDDGIWVGTKRETAQRIASALNPGPPVWSPDGTTIAYTANKRVWIVHPGGTPTAISPQFDDISSLSWSRENDAVAYTVRGALELSYLTGKTVRMAATVGVGASFAHKGDLLAFSGSHPGCAGHASIRIYEDSTDIPSLTGGCGIAGTAGPDVIYGTSQGGDKIAAGAGNDTVHANNRHRDTVNCGSGRDTVYADKTDRLLGCEVVHR